MKNIMFLIAVMFTSSVANAENLAVGFDGNNTTQLSSLIDSIEPTPTGAPAEVASTAELTKAAAPQSYYAMFDSENEANQALPVIGRKFEAAGCVILASGVTTKTVDAAGRVYWNVWYSYLAPPNLTTQSYFTIFYSENEANQALSLIGRKFEAAGCVVLTSGVTTKTVDAAGRVYWNVWYSYLTTSGQTAQSYNASFNSEYEARQALPGLVQKFEAAGYVILTASIARSVDAVGRIDWGVSLSYILPAK